MINLLPPEAKRKVSREYVARLTMVALLAGIALIALAAALKVPSYLLLNGQVDAYSAQYFELQTGQANLKAAEETIKGTNALARHLAAPEPVRPSSEIIATLDRLAGSNVTIQQFEIDQSAEKVTKIVIRGNAVNRISLAAFSDAVAAHPDFAEANVPIANLAKDQDIDFEINVVPAETQ